jgi:hypothetical protein
MTTETQAVDPMLHFTVRKRLQIHRQVFVERLDPTNRKIRDKRIESYGDAMGRMSIDLPPDEVKMYAHALEPTDERSAAALEALHFKQPVRAQELSHETQSSIAMVAAVISALREAGALSKIPDGPTADIQAIMTAKASRSQKPRSEE